MIVGVAVLDDVTAVGVGVTEGMDSTIEIVPSVAAGMALVVVCGGL